LIAVVGKCPRIDPHKQGPTDGRAARVARGQFTPIASASYGRNRSAEPSLQPGWRSCLLLGPMSLSCLITAMTFCKPS
jgi:hypothetical protein